MSKAAAISTMAPLTDAREKQEFVTTVAWPDTSYPEHKRGRVYEELTRIVNEKREAFSRKNWESITGIRRWKVVSLIVMLCLMFAWALIAWRSPALARQDWFLLIFLIQSVTATVIIMTVAIRPEELKRETPRETVDSIKGGGDADCHLTRDLQGMVSWPSFATVQTEIRTDLELFESRIRSVSDILTSLGPAPAAVAALVGALGNQPRFVSVIVTGVLIVGAMSTLMKVFLHLAAQPYVTRRRQYLMIMERTKFYSEEMRGEKPAATSAGT